MFSASFEIFFWLFICKLEAKRLTVFSVLKRNASPSFDKKISAIFGGVTGKCLRYLFKFDTIGSSVLLTIIFKYKT